MNSGIYQIRNVTNDKIYVGSTINFSRRKTRHFKDLRIGKHSSIKLQRSFDKHGEENFVFEVLEEAEYNKDTIIVLENEYIKKLDSKQNGYNIADASFGDMLTSHPNRLEIIEKRSKTLKIKNANLTQEERRNKWGQFGSQNGMFGRKRSREEMANCFEAHKQFIREHGHGWAKGSKRSEEDRKKLSERAKLRIGDKNSFFGRTHSAETRKNISDKNKGKKCQTLRPFFIDGVRYERLKDAEAAIGIKGCTIWYRCGSKNPKFETFYFEDAPK